MTTKATPPLTEIIRLLPGYDPYRDKGDCKFDPVAGQFAIDFFHEVLTHVKTEWAKKPLFLEPWQQAIVANLWGWKQPDGLRRYRQALIFVPRKNAKTTLAGGLVNLALFTDFEPGAEIYGAASTHKQACYVWDVVRGQIRNSSVLASRCRCYDGQDKSIVLNSDPLSTYRVVSSDAEGQWGGSPHMAALDELHVQPTRKLYDALTSGSGSRSQPLILMLTTSDYERPDSICNIQHEYASHVRDGIVTDPQFLPVIYEADKDDDWHDEAVWRKANPNFRISVKEDYFMREYRQACAMSPQENRFKRLNLNVRTEQAVRWLSMDLWDQCRGDVNPVALYKQTCYAGLDLASTSDLTAFVLVFPINERRLLVPMFWIPEDVVQERARKGKRDYAEWVKMGLMKTTPGNMTDYAVVRRDINEFGKQYGIRQIAADRLFQGAQLSMELAGDGFNVFAHGQGFLSMAAPTLEFETLVKSGRLEHGGHPILRWMAANASVEIDPAGCMKPTKKESSGKIDGIVCAVMGVGRAAAHAGEQQVTLPKTAKVATW